MFRSFVIERIYFMFERRISKEVRLAFRKNIFKETETRRSGREIQVF